MDKYKVLSRGLLKQGLLGAVNLLKNGISFFTEPPEVNASPLIIQIEPTINCNLKCKMCASPLLKRQERCLKLEQFKQIVVQFPYLQKISLVGAGEPLLNPEIFDMISYAKSQGIDIGFATNATLLNRGVVDKIISSKVDWVNLSLDGATKEVYESIRVGANFDSVLSNIRNLMIALKGKDRPEISIWFVLMRSNLAELSQVVSLAKNLGINNISVQTVHYWGSAKWKTEMAKENVRNELDEVKNVLKKASVLARSSRINFNYVNIPGKKGRRNCKWPWRSCYITCDGYVTPCCLHGTNPELINFGNILKNPFSQIWNNQFYGEFRAKLKSRNPPAICVDCTSYYDKIRL